MSNNDVSSHPIFPTFNQCGDFIIDGGWQLGPRINWDYEIVYFPEASKSTYTVNYEESYELNQPCFIFTPIDVTHQYHFAADKPIRHLFIHFSTKLTKESPVTFIPSFIPASQLPLVPSLMMRIIHLASSKPARYEERISTMLLTAIEELASVHETVAVMDQAPPQPILQVLRYIDEHLSEPISIGSLAQISGWSHEYFTRYFVKVKGVAPNRYILQRRIETACHMLTFQNKSVKEIAFATGFRSEQYFSRAFKQLTGSTPTAYRAQHTDPRFYKLHLAQTNDELSPYPLNHYFD